MIPTAALHSQDEAAQVFVLGQSLQSLADQPVVDDDLLLLPVGSVEADVLEHAFQDRMQPAGANVLSAAIDLERQIGHGLDGIARELERHPLGGEQSLVLAQKRGTRLAKDASEIVA